MVMKLPLTLAHIRICPLLRMRNSTTRLHRHEVPSRAEPPQETFERIVRKKVGAPASPEFGRVLPGLLLARYFVVGLDRKSTRLNSSHSQISYAVFCLKKKQ